MSLSKQLWESNWDLALACQKHPFVQGIGAGTLSRSHFAFYVGQDAFFLEAFARAYSIAAAKAPDWEGFTSFHRLGDGVIEELRLHAAYAKGWDVDLATVQPAAATRHYTDFLLATAWSHSPGTIAIAMTPCLRLYAYLGQELAAQGIPDHDYRDWISTYSSERFEAQAQQLEALVDRYAYAPAQEITQSVYRYALLCEQAFFTAAWQEREG
ncbi:MAG: TenA family protein [Chloroflexaceae bacterium]|nr:TenA family protein [Chloroflexaceae bacterium]